jgi:hypothetical protein
MDKLLAKLSEQQAAINKQRETLKSDDEITSIAYSRTMEYITSTNNVGAGEGNEELELAASVSSHPSSSIDPEARPKIQTGEDEVALLKRELEQSKAKMAAMDQELTQSRITKHTVEHVLGGTSEADFGLGLGITHPPEIIDRRLGQTLNASLRPTSASRDRSWDQIDSRSDTSETLSAGGFNRARALWSSNVRADQYPSYQAGMPDFLQPPPSGPWTGRGGYGK